MSYMRTISLAAVCMALSSFSFAAPAPPPSSPPAAVPPRSGTYTPAAGTAIPWRINRAGTLIWNDLPWLPTGGYFTPQSLFNSSAQAWQADQNALNTLLKAGIRDLVIWPSHALTLASQQALQRLLDLLNSQGFHYGIAFGQTPLPPLSGFLVHPSIYRFDNPNVTVAHWQVDNSDAAAWFTFDPKNNSRILQDGMAQMDGSTASAPNTGSPDVSHPITLLLPHVVLPPAQHLPDVWSGFDSYRDALLQLFAKIKFGPGLRFFLDPLGPSASLPASDDLVVPDSLMFHLEWQQYLQQKYGSGRQISSHWVLSDTIKDIGLLSRLVPLWSRGRGIPYLYDPSTGKTWQVLGGTSPGSGWWADFYTWRNKTLRASLNSMANLLKKRVADVPVVCTEQPNSFLLTQRHPDGYDGIAVQTTAMQPWRTARVTGAAYASAAWSSQPLWFIASPIQGVPAESSSSASIGYPSLSALDQDITDMRRIGLKAFFFDGFQTPASQLQTTPDWLQKPDQLAWLNIAHHDFDSDSLAATLLPRVFYYPVNAPGGAQIGITPSTAGVYWLPSDTSGSSLNFWPSFNGYTIQMPDDSSRTVLWSLFGPRTVRFELAKPRLLQVFTPGGNPVPVKYEGKNDVLVPFGTEPLVFQTSGQTLFPVQAATDVQQLLILLLNESRGKKIPVAAFAGMQADQDIRLLKEHDYLGVYAGAMHQVNLLAPLLSPYRWIEGEDSVGSNFPNIVQNPAASNGAYLHLDTIQQPALASAYAARYVFDLPSSGSYTIWVAGTPPGSGTSPLGWYIDHNPENDPLHSQLYSARYLDSYFAWYPLGTVNMKAGPHALTLHVRKPVNGRYRFSIDAIAISPQNTPFVPDAAVRPLPLDNRLAVAFTTALLKQKP